MAAVDAYWFDTASPLSAQILLNHNPFWSTCALTSIPSLRSCASSMYFANMLWHTFVLSRQSIQFDLMTPP